MTSRLQSRGFTLVELLVVIAIVAVLIAVLLPALGEARDIAQRVKCLAGARQGSIAMLAYATDNDEYFTDGLAAPYHATLTKQDYASTELFTDRGCPHGPEDFNAGAGSSYYFSSNNKVGYGANAIVVTTNGYYPPGSWQSRGPMHLNRKRLLKFSHVTPLVYDNHHAGSSSHVQTVNIRAMLGIPAYDADPWAIGAVRHKGKGLNFTFVDGSGKYVEKDQTWITSHNYHKAVAGLGALRMAYVDGERIDEENP